MSEPKPKRRFLVALVTVAISAFTGGIALIALFGLVVVVGWLVLLGVFVATYVMFTKIMANNYRSEGHGPTAAWPSNYPPTPP
jgi:hypothetical protein